MFELNQRGVGNYALESYTIPKKYIDVYTKISSPKSYYKAD